MTESGQVERAAGPSRRQFLRTAGAAAASLAWSRTAASAQRVIGANDRINWGIIGCGGQAGAHINNLMAQIQNKESNCAITAVCDVYQIRLEDAARRTGAKPYRDYRELLASPDVDVVLVATPEHWHCRQVIDAFDAGKDVYCEKPLIRYWQEAIEVADAAARTKRILQVGAQWTSEPKWQQAHRLIDKIGHPVWSQTSYCRNSVGGEWNYPIDQRANPDNLDWKAWLGPAPERPFDLERYFRWRKYWDYSSGIAGDLFCHRIYPLMIALGPEMPTRVVATGGIYVHHDREVPDTYHLLATFPSGHTMFVAGSTANEQGPTPMILGHEATMYLGSGSEIDIRPERPFAEDAERVVEKCEPCPDPMKAHHQNFMECVRTRKEPVCGPTVAIPGMLVVALSEVSYREQRAVVFDPEKRQIVG